MKTSDMVRELCEKQNVSIAELARRIDQSPQNFGKKIKRDTISLDEMMAIAVALGVSYEQAFVMNDGEQIKVSSIDAEIINKENESC